MTVHNHDLDPMCAERHVDGYLLGACMSDDRPDTAAPAYLEPVRDLTEREADANALQGYRDHVARLEAAMADNEAAYVKCNARAARAESRLATSRAEVLEFDAALALNMGRLERAEARVDQLADTNERLIQELALTQDTLRHRTNSHTRLVADRLGCPHCSTLPIEETPA